MTDKEGQADKEMETMGPKKNKLKRKSEIVVKDEMPTEPKKKRESKIASGVLSGDDIVSSQKTQKKDKKKKSKKNDTEESLEIDATCLSEKKKKTKDVKESDEFVVKEVNVDDSVTSQRTDKKSKKKTKSAEIVESDKNDSEENQTAVKKKKDKKKKKEKENTDVSENEKKDSAKADDVVKSKKTKGKKKSKKSKTVDATGEDTRSRMEKALDYLREWQTDRSSWKFEKLKQMVLLNSMFDTTKIPDEDFEIILSYLEGLVGKGREKTLEDAEKKLNVLDEADQKDQNEEEYERIRQVIQVLS